MSAQPLPARVRLQPPACHDTNAQDAEPPSLEAALKSKAQLEKQVAQLRSALTSARRDLQGMRAGERRAHHSAQHDCLTQLPNRRYFEDCLQAALADPASVHQGLALFFLDLDDFKHVNDTHGHAAGDTLLRVVAGRLHQAVRKEDVVCRLGGDEFACLLRGLRQIRQLTQLAAKLFDSVAAPCRLDTCELSVRPSIGIAICSPQGMTGHDLLAHADVAMYRAKREQTGYAFFDLPA